MDNNKSISETLEEEKKQIVEQIEELKGDLQAVERLLRKHKIKEEKQMSIPLGNSHKKSLGPTDALKQIFNSNPDKSWTPSELTEKIREMKEKGYLKTDSNNMLSAVHTVLRKKVINGSIIKVTSGKKPKYKKSASSWE